MCKKEELPGGSVVRAPIARTRVLSLVGELTSLSCVVQKRKKIKSDMGLGIHCQIQVLLGSARIE